MTCGLEVRCSIQLSYGRLEVTAVLYARLTTESFCCGDSDDGMAAMSMTHKPAEPYKEFPLFAHPIGQWIQKIKGKTCTSGSEKTGSL